MNVGSFGAAPALGASARGDISTACAQHAHQKSGRLGYCYSLAA